MTDDARVASCAETLRARHGRVDIVISNAAARMVRERPISEQVGPFIATNNHGTFRMLRAFVPLLKDGARFVVVASSFGSLRNLAPDLHARFDIATRSMEDIEQCMGDYARLVVAGQGEAHHWPAWINVPSKVAQVASTKIAARLLKSEATRRGILINAVCPGLVDTEASRPWFDDMCSAPTPAQGASRRRRGLARDPRSDKYRRPTASSCSTGRSCRGRSGPLQRCSLRRLALAVPKSVAEAPAAS